MAGDRSGIHDPAGPVGGWGAGEKKSQQERVAQEDSFKLQEREVANQMMRSEQRSGHQAGHAIVGDRAHLVSRELQEMEDEKADEEYSHMGRVQKWIMEAKGALYAWLKTGVEPL